MRNFNPERTENFRVTCGQTMGKKSNSKLFYTNGITCKKLFLIFLCLSSIPLTKKYKNTVQCTLTMKKSETQNYIYKKKKLASRTTFAFFLL